MQIHVDQALRLDILALNDNNLRRLRRTSSRRTDNQKRREGYAKLVRSRKHQYMKQRKTIVRKKKYMKKNECETIQKILRHIRNFKTGLNYLNHLLSKGHILFL